MITDECVKCRKHGLDQDENGGDDVNLEAEVIQQGEESWPTAIILLHDWSQCQSGCSTVGLSHN